MLPSSTRFNPSVPEPEIPFTDTVYAAPPPETVNPPADTPLSANAKSEESTPLTLSLNVTW